MDLDRYIPLDKSWIIRIGILDLLNDRNEVLHFLSRQEFLGDDLLVLQKVLNSWKERKINVGESGTLFRFLQFISWKLKLGKIFVKEGTLKTRSICDDSAIVDLKQNELLKLDNGTSQWASAAVLCGDAERLKNPPYKLQLTYDAVTYWEEKKLEGVQWESRKDKTIKQQANAFLS